MIFWAGGAFDVLVGGVLVQSYSPSPDGSYDYHYYAAINFDGGSYTSYDDTYSSSNVRTGRTFYDASGNAQASETFLTGGGFTDTIGGVTYQTFTPGAGGSYDYRYYLSGTFQGLTNVERI